MTDKMSGTSQKRRRGRPRKTESEKMARQAEIIDAAIALFARKPFRDTTMSDIARAAGLDQSSLYYWFKNKEELLEAILQKSQSSMLLASRISALHGEKPLYLYSIVYSDVIMMCDLPVDYFDLEAAALANPDRLESFFETYRTLRETMENIVLQGVEDGDLSSADPALTVSVALSLTEGLQHQYHRALATNDNPKTSIWNRSLVLSKHQVARLAADTVLGSLMKHPDVASLYEEAVERELIPSSQDCD